MMSNKTTNPIPARSQPGSTMTALSVGHQDGRVKYDTGESSQQKIRGRNFISLATWNVRTLNQTGKCEELTHELENYRWDMVGLCEVRWKNFGEHQTEDGHVLYYSGESDKHTNGVGFLVNRTIKNCVLECQPISSRVISIRLRATPFNITVLQAYAPTTSHDDDVVEEFYTQLQSLINKVHKKDILIIQGDWNAKVGKDALKDWKQFCGSSCNEVTNERGLRLLEFASYNNMVLANTLGQHKASRCWTWHAPNGIHHNQIDYILVKNRFISGIKRGSTRSYPGADVGSDHDMVMMNFKVRLKKTKKSKNTRLKFNLDRLKDPDIAESFKATIGGKFAPLLALEDNSMETLITQFNEVLTEAANETLGKVRRKSQAWVTDEILEVCDKRRSLKKSKTTPTGAADYRKANKTIRKMMKQAKEDFIGKRCAEIESSLEMNNSRRAFQIVKDLTKPKQTRVNTIQDKAGNCLTEEDAVLKRWTEYCSDLYNYQTQGDPNVTVCQESTNDDDFPILRVEVVAAIRTLKSGKAAGVDNIPAELIKHGGESVVDMLLLICNKIWQTGEWPTPWTQSLIITLPKKGNLQQCQNYRTLSLISHASKVMLRIILKRLSPQAEDIIAEEQAGFRRGRSTAEQIFNLRVLCEKYSQHQQDIFHVFIDYKKAFDRVWHDALWATMKNYNMGQKLVMSIQQLYKNATSAVLAQGKIGDWFHTSVGVRQGCLLSPTLFNIFLEQIMTDALEDHVGTVSIGGRVITNLRFADDIDGLAGSEAELVDLVKRLDETSTRYGMEISAGKTKLMRNTDAPINTSITVSGQQLDTVTHFKYLGAIISEVGSKPEIHSRIALTTAAPAKLKPIWKDTNISVKTKMRLLRALILSILLYACESWTLTAELQRKIQAVEMRCFRRLLGISYTDHITNEVVRSRIQEHMPHYIDLLTTVKRRKLKWYGHVTRSSGLSKTIMQGTVQGKRKRGRQRKRWTDNIKEWTGMTYAETQALAHDRDRWGMLVRSSIMQRPYDPGGLWDQ